MTTDKEHLQWMLNRLAEVHGENRNVDYMVRMQKIINNTETELNLHLVSKCVDDVINHIEDAEIAIPIDDLFNKDGSNNLGNGTIANVSNPLFKNRKDAIRVIEAYVGAAFVQDRVMTSDEYGKVKEATIWLSLNDC